MNIYTSETEYLKTQVQRLSALVRAQQITIDKLEAQTEQEPVAFENWHKANYVQNLEKYGDTYKNNHVRCRHQGWLGAQSITAQRTWVGLTDWEISQLWISTSPYFNEDDFAKAIEAKLKEKNT